jgi:hypothetical protein
MWTYVKEKHIKKNLPQGSAETHRSNDSKLHILSPKDMSTHPPHHPANQPMKHTKKKQIKKL